MSSDREMRHRVIVVRGPLMMALVVLMLWGGPLLLAMWITPPDALPHVSPDVVISDPWLPFRDVAEALTRNCRQP